MIVDILKEAVHDSVSLLPFLFITYLILEGLEGKFSTQAENMIRKAGRFGPCLGGLLGMLPQCGFSAAAAGFYTGRVITLGTLIAVFLSTSDEMLPILLAKDAPLSFVLSILIVKAGIGCAAGFLVDLMLKGKRTNISELPYHENQIHKCSHNPVLAALRHTAEVLFSLFVFSFFIQLLMIWIGEDMLQNTILTAPVLGEVLAGLVGMIPNCASSVMLTQLYLEGGIGFGPLLSGLLAGSGAGILVLFQANRNRRENWKIAFLLFGIGVFSGCLVRGLGFIDGI